MNNLNAQTHTFMPGWCKLAKSTGKSAKSESAIHQCQVCDAKDKKEKDAKLAEDNRRAKVISDKYKADKIASENIRKAKQLEDAKNAYSGEVLINGNSNVAVKNIPSSKIYQSNKLQKIYFYSINRHDNSNSIPDNYFDNGNNGFIINGDTIFKKNEFKSCHGIASVPLNNNPEINKYNFPPNIGIVILNEEKIIPPRNGRTSINRFAISDLVDSKGKRILNDDNISAILHFADDYFILLKGFYSISTGYSSVITGWSFDDASIYNIKTKISHPIQKDNNSRGIGVSHATNFGRTASGDVSDEWLFSKETYKAFFVTEVGVREFVVYYITNEGSIKEQKINH
jgi:hypothetical protein